MMEHTRTSTCLHGLAWLGLLLMGAFATPLAAEEKPLLQEGKKTLYQRVLTTPGCQLRESTGASTGKAVPTFTRFYVYQRDKQWLRVGPDSLGKSIGWIDKACSVEWKMQMTLVLTNPADREPLLFFRERIAQAHSRQHEKLGTRSQGDRPRA